LFKDNHVLMAGRRA